ncbi:hypothetical protein [Mesorhizobium sp. LNJC405B00]|uniref:hypothetical protein n=1 Tax=Mesorhizobium sp. LNJC405B00 TaxID=1287281 RepID=UPI0012EC8A4F|nr:hypothetical protein [Mesorhizobium sp. LNJC405B00]
MKKGGELRYLILIDSRPDPGSGYFSDLSDAKHHAEQTAAKQAHAIVSIEGYPEGRGGPMSTWQYDRDAASWVSTT